MTKQETSERFRIRNSRCFIYKNPIICVSNKLLSIIDLQGMPDELRRRKARKYLSICWTHRKNARCLVFRLLYPALPALFDGSICLKPRGYQLEIAL
jgi:hypothetical protein